ncbi:MAG: restriction endonuclease subunit S [Planctomycetota bacterium]
MTCALDITAEQRKTLLALLRRFIPGVAVWAYGSRVKWTARPNSDLDLVVFPTPAQRQRVSELKDALAESSLPFPVDVHFWDQVPEPFHAIIRKEYVVLQEVQENLQRASKAIGWRESTWGEEISLEYGKALRNYDTVSGKFRVFGSNGPIGWTSQPLAPGPGVILGRKGAYRGVEFSRDPFFVIDTAYYVVPKTELDMRWLFYAINHHKLGEIDDGSPIPSTTRAAVYVRDIQIPPLPEQRAIAHILGTLDDKIELNRRMNETLEAMARALFKSWFVDFDPVRAKAAGRQPAGLSREIAALFPDRLEDSGLGKIPKGWKVSTLGPEVERCGGVVQTGPFGSQLHASDYVVEGVPVVMPQDISNRRVRTDDIAHIREADAHRLGRHRLQPGDLVYSRRGNVEIHALVGIREEKWLCGTGCLLVRPGRSWPSPQYLSLALDEPATRAWIRQRAVGATMPNLNTGILASVPLLVPPDDLLTHFARKAEVLEDHMTTNDAQSRTLAALRDALLPKLLSGEIRVQGTERTVGRAL